MYRFPLTEGFLPLCSHIKLLSLKIYKTFGIGSPRPRPFLFILILSPYDIFWLLLYFVWLKWIEGIRTFNFRPGLLKFWLICLQKTGHFKKIYVKKNIFLWKFRSLNKLIFFFRIRTWLMRFFLRPYLVKTVIFFWKNWLRIRSWVRLRQKL